jgi:hypothetical protein
MKMHAEAMFVVVYRSEQLTDIHLEARFLLFPAPVAGGAPSVSSYDQERGPSVPF